MMRRAALAVALILVAFRVSAQDFSRPIAGLLVPDLSRWYWVVGGDEARVYSSAARGYVPATDAAYADWLRQGRLPSRIVSESELWDVLAAQVPAALPVDAAAQDKLRDRNIEAIGPTTFRIICNLASRVSVLEGKAALTPAQ